MAQLSDDCFAFGGRLATAAEALAELDRRLTAVVDRETVALDAALGRILAEDVTSPRAVPPHDNAAVDGFAVRYEDLAPDGETRLGIVGRAAAGHPFAGVPPRGSALRVLTGAPMPPGPDTVFMQEDCRVEGAEVIVPPGIKKGANRRRAGEDIALGATILGRGRRLRAQDLGLAASVGRATLVVHRPLRVAVFSTGDEVRDIGAELPAGCIFDANRHVLLGLLRALGTEVSDLGIVADRYEAVHAALARAAAGHDLLVTSGGMSTGEEDHVRAAVAAQGSIHFWRLAIRPGRPLAFGQVGRVPFIGLPGNPVAMMVTFLRFARPAILRLAGATVEPPMQFPVRARFDYKKKAGRREWVRVRLAVGDGGMPDALKFPRDGAGILSSMVESDGLVELPEELTRVEPGTIVSYMPFSEVA